jgi:hypothetical protein
MSRGTIVRTNDEHRCMKWRILTDEHISYAITGALRSRGIDVETVQEAGFVSHPDDEILEYAAAHNRTVFSFNKRDFVILHHEYLATGRNHAGILLMPESEIKPALKALMTFILTNDADQKNMLHHL